MVEETKNQKAVADMLAIFLANTYALYLKTQNYHWNVTGSEFYTLHKVFEGHYEGLAEAVDMIAERIRQIGHFAPASFKEFATLATIKDADGVPAAKEMAKQLLADHEAVAAFARDNFHIPEGINDQGTMDVLDDRIDWHEKTAWMLRSYLS